MQKKIGLIGKREVDDGSSKQPLLTHGEIQIPKLFFLAVDASYCDKSWRMRHQRPAEYSISPSSFLFRELKYDQIPLTCCDSSSIKYRECSGIARLLLRFPFKSWTSSGDYVTAWVGNENANNSSLSKATIINKIPTSVAFRASLWPSAVLMYLEMTGSRSSVVYR